MAVLRPFFDASALAKRYVPERGTAVVDHILHALPRSHMSCLMLGAGEVAAVLARRRNEGKLSASAFTRAQDGLFSEVIDSEDFGTPAVTNADIVAAVPFLTKHAVNITDAVLLRVALNLQAVAARAGERLVLVACDGRVLRAADAEGLATFNPETQSEAELDALLAAP